MLTISLTFVVVAAVSVIGTPSFARFASRIGMVVKPRADRWHAKPTPLLGGAGIALALLGGLAVTLPLSLQAAALIVCAATAFALGLLDDFRRMSPSTKLAGQVLIASMLAAAGIRVAVFEFAPLAYVVSVLWVVGIMNAVNLMDNMDGLAAGISAIAALVLAATAWPSDMTTVLIAAVTAAAALGFLVHNFNPARVFMGDAGSQLLGFMLAATALVHTTRAATNLGLAILAPLAALALPIFDTTLVTMARRLAGRPVSQGGRDHTSHRLAALGLSDRAVVLLLYAVAGGFGLLALSTEIVAGVALPLFVLAVICLILFGVFLLEVAGHKPQPGAGNEQRRLAKLLGTYGRFGGEIALDVALLTTVYYLSYIIRFEGQPDDVWLYLFAQSVPIIVGLQITAMVGLGVYRTLWRYLGIGDAALIVRAVTLGSGVAVLVLLLTTRFAGYSRAAVLLDWVLACAVIIGARSFLLWLIFVFSQRPRPDARRVLIAGADDTGIVALRLLAQAEDVAYQVVGFIDDDPGKRYRRVAGVPVVGNSGDLASLIERLQPDLVVSTKSDSAELRTTCEEFGIAWRTFSLEV